MYRCRLIAYLVLLLMLPGVVVGQVADQVRVLKSFDFEERERGNVEDVPMDWVKLEGPGMPHYVNGKLSSVNAASGKYSFKFDLNGGSLVYRYPAGKIKVHPHANYRVAVMTKADPLPNARVRLTAYFADIDARPVKNSIRHSKLFAGGSDQWTQLEVELDADENCKSLVIELSLLQPSVYRASTLGQAALFEQDIKGTAYFDDLVIAQVPRSRMSTDRPGNIFKRSEPMAVRMRINDRFTDDLVCKLIVTDAQKRNVHQYNGGIPLTLEPGRDPQEAAKIGSVSLPDLPAGWYRVSMQLSSHGVVVGDESLDLIRLADEGARINPDQRFGMIATHLPMSGWGELPALLPYLGAARIKLAVWNDQDDVESQQLKFSLLLESLRDLRITPTACLAAPPPKVANLIGGTTWPQILKAPAETWQPQLSYMISRYSAFLDRWQFGVDDQANEFVSNPAMRRAYQAVYKQFAALMQKPDLAMPWPAFFEPEGDLPPSVALSIPSEILPEQLPLYINDMRAKAGQQLSLSLQLLSADRYGREAQLRDYVQRIVYALSAGADRIDLPLPFTVAGASNQTVKQPSELFLVMRTMMQTLGHTTYKGRVPVGDDVEAFLFDRAGEGVMILWSKAGTGDKANKTVQIVLGNQPRRVDLWGNISPVLQPKNDSGVIDVEVGSMPLILVGIDGQLAQMRSSFAFDNPLIESSFKPHVRRLRFINPYTTTLSGRLRMTGPNGWNITPQVPNFSLAPGETYDAAVTIEFPYSSFAGMKSIVCDVELQSGDTRNFKVPVSLKLGLGDVGLNTLALRDGSDVIVQQVITNYSTKPVDYTAYALVPGQARQERLVTGLKAGQTIIKKYRFTGVDFARDPAARLVRSGVKELEGTRVLNDEVTVQ